MLATVDDIHHRSRKNVRASSTQIAIQRQLHTCRGSFAVASETPSSALAPKLAALVRRSIEIAHDAIDLALIDRVHTDQGIGDFAVNVFDRFGNTFAEENRFVAIA